MSQSKANLIQPTKNQPKKSVKKFVFLYNNILLYFSTIFFVGWIVLGLPNSSVFICVLYYFTFFATQQSLEIANTLVVAWQV